MLPILLNWSVGILWTVKLAACCSKPSRPLIRTLKKSSSRCTWSRRARITFLMKSARQGFRCSGRGNPQRSRIGRGRSTQMSMSGKFLRCSTVSPRSSLLDRLCLVHGDQSRDGLRGYVVLTLRSFIAFSLANVFSFSYFRNCQEGNSAGSRHVELL